MTLMRTMGDSWSATMPGASAVERAAISAALIITHRWAMPGAGFGR
jgi:hypothetical protein